MKTAALTIVQTLQSNGFEAYFAGGCVRDMLLKKESSDIDIATNALPEEIENLFKKTFPIGKHFGVILIEQDGHHFEIATFRSDSGQTDGRRPEYVTFTTAKEDAMRRDFTINGMFYNPVTKEIIDFVDGQSDLKRKVISFIGDGEKRIREDYLRILRAVRFKHRFGLEYDRETRTALSLHATAVFNVSAERVQEELNKIITHHSRAKAFQDMYDLQILQHLIPEVTEMHNTPQPEDHHSEGDVFTHTMKAMANMPEGENLELYWAMFFHDMGKAFTKTFDGNRWRYPDHENVSEEKARKILNIFSFPKKSIQKICWLVSHEQLFDQFFQMKLATRLQYYDHPYFEDLIKLHKYDVLGSVPKGEQNKESKQKRLAMIHQIEENLEFAKANKLLPSHNAELLTGKEIMNLTGLSEGAEIGNLKKQVREAQIEGFLLNKEEAIAFVRSSLNTESE